MAHVLRTWLPDVIQAVEPWMSEHDIGKGGRGLREIADELSGCNFGILCITAENQSSQWVNFEAGALSKQVDDALVVPMLLDIKVADLTGPLTQFQATESFAKSDVGKLMVDMNSAQKGESISTERLARTFDRYWSDLDGQLEKIRATPVGGGRGNSNRSNSDMLSEMLVLMRQQDRRLVQLEDALLYSNHRLDQKIIGDPVRQWSSQDAALAAMQRVSLDGLEREPLAQLQEIASMIGLRGTARMRKSQVIAAIRQFAEQGRLGESAREEG